MRYAPVIIKIGRTLGMDGYIIELTLINITFSPIEGGADNEVIFIKKTKILLASLESVLICGSLILASSGHSWKNDLAFEESRRYELRRSCSERYLDSGCFPMLMEDAIDANRCQRTSSW